MRAVSFFISLFCLFSCSKYVYEMSIVEGNHTIEKGVYVCMGQKSCFSCLRDLTGIKTLCEKKNKVKLGLILETNMDNKTARLEMQRIENELNYSNDIWIFDKVKYNGPFSSTCGFLCDKKLSTFPAVFVQLEDTCYSISYNRLFNNYSLDSSLLEFYLDKLD